MAQSFEMIWENIKACKVAHSSYIFQIWLRGKRLFCPIDQTGATLTQYAGMSTAVHSHRGLSDKLMDPSALPQQHFSLVYSDYTNLTFMSLDSD